MLCVIGVNSSELRTSSLLGGKATGSFVSAETQRSHIRSVSILAIHVYFHTFHHYVTSYLKRKLRLLFSLKSALNSWNNVVYSAGAL